MNDNGVSHYERLKWFYEQEIERIKQSMSYTKNDDIRRQLEWKKKGVMVCLEKLDYVYKFY